VARVSSSAPEGAERPRFDSEARAPGRGPTFGSPWARSGLLILRVDRGLSWRDLELAMNDADAARMGDAELKKCERRLRQRFKRVKDRLRELAKEDGLS